MIVNAQYFDGQSAVSQKTTLEFNTVLKELDFQTETNDSLTWRMEDLEFEKYDHLLQIRNKKYSGAILKIEDENFAEEFYELMKQNRRIDLHTRLLNLGLGKITAIAIAMFALMVLAYFYVLPPMAEKAAAFLPESFDDEIGNVFMKTFLKEEAIDSTKTKYLAQFAKEINLENKKPLHFAVVNSKEVNAFALPNGQIVVYTGILKNIETPDELVALLGHEASHVNHRHSVKMLCRNLAGYMAISLIFSDANGVMAILVDNAQQLQSLSYSRLFEQEADEQGLKILMDNHLNPKGMINLFEHLEKEDKTVIPKIMSSHPMTKDRLANMKQIIAKSAFKINPNPKLQGIFEKMKE